MWFQGKVLQRNAKTGAADNTAEVNITYLTFDFLDPLVITLEHKNNFSPSLSLFGSVLMYRMWSFIRIKHHSCFFLFNTVITIFTMGVL